VVVGSVELGHGLAANELLSCDVEAVRVALDRLKSWAAGSLSWRAGRGSPSCTAAA
jgi:hypothetical protein